MNKASLFVLLAFASTGCVVSPNHGDHVGTRSTPISFTIMSITSGESIQITCSHHYGPATVISSYTGGTSPVVINGETLYASPRTLTLPMSCWEPWSGPNYSYITYVRVRQGQYTSLVFDEAGSQCLGEQLGDGEAPSAAAMDCDRGAPDILLFANP